MRSTSGWISLFPDYNANGTNICGFNALPGGTYDTINTTYHSNGYWGYWWSSATQIMWQLDGWGSTLEGPYNGSMENFFSVRCVRD